MAFNLSGGTAGGLGGAASGATIGSLLFPGVGTAIGAGIGGLAGLLGGGLTGAKSKGKKGSSGSSNAWGQSPNKFTPQQQKVLNDLLSQASQGLKNPSAGFEPIAAQARQQFNTETIPSLAERFTSLGTGGSQRSSAFQGALGSAGAGLETGLAALQSQYGLENREGLMRQLQLGLTPQTEQIYFGEQPGFGQSLLQMGGNLTGNYLAGGGDFGFGGRGGGVQQGGIASLPTDQKLTLIRLLQNYLKK